MAGVGLVFALHKGDVLVEGGEAEGGGVLSPSDSEISNSCPGSPEISFSICAPLFDFIISSHYWETITNQAGDWARGACTTTRRLVVLTWEDGNETPQFQAALPREDREMLQAPSPGHQEGETRFRNRGILDLQKQQGYKIGTCKKFRQVRKTNWRIC